MDKTLTYLQRPFVCVTETVVGLFRRPKCGRCTVDLIVMQIQHLTLSITDVYYEVLFTTAALEMLTLQHE